MENMGILVSIIIGIVAITLFIILNARNLKKLEKMDDFSEEIREREDFEEDENENADFLENQTEYQEEIDDRDMLGEETVSINNSPKSVENIGEENIEYSKHIYFAKEDITSGNFKDARKRLERAAKISMRGNYELGKYYYYCENDIQNSKKMSSYAYNGGIKEAAYYLGLLEEKSGNLEAAKDWYNAGAEKGDIMSIVKLGKTAEEQEDYENAEKFYLKLADTKDAKAMYNIVRLYFKQNMIEKVLEWQQKLLNESQLTGLTSDMIKNMELMAGSEKDRKFMDLINQGNEFLEKKDYENAQKLFSEAVNYNEAGYLTLAKSYYITDDEEKAKSTFEKAYGLGVKEAAYYLGDYSDSIEEDMEGAAKWYRVGQEMGDIKSTYELAILYECVSEFGKTEEEVYEIYEGVANMKYAPAMYDMMNYVIDLEDERKVKEWAFKILSESGLIELDARMLKDAQEILEEYGEQVENKVLTKNDEIDYDEKLMYCIRKALKK